jgi:hypothetical protein
LINPPRKGDIGSRPQRRVKIRLGGGTGKPGIHADQLGAVFHGVGDPFERYGMVLRRVGSHNENAVTVSNVDPVVGHCAAPERLCQSRNRSAVSDTGLVFDIDQTQGAHEGLNQPAFLIVQGRASHTGDAQGAVDHLPFVVFELKAGIPAFLDPFGNV